MTPQEIHQSLTDRFGEEVVLGFEAGAKDPWIEIAAPRIAEVGQFVKSDPALKLDMLCDLSGVDYLEPDAKLAKKFPFEPHVEVVYHLLSIEHNHKITLKVKLPRWKDDQSGQLPSVPSVSGVWAIADWHEREAYDLVGIFFEGHPNLVRILCPDDWEGHPLRKDYEFPLEYHGIRG
ncbi:NADH-quinone oxidoreductase subunit C [Thalassoglobus sp. JC818]|uniref:NADH-quinone oxidoreductase subunit C n=1 Tax=Thalassoglobus sp. JC818 TaxID=3232136 RepID=UPI003458A979